MTTAIKYQGRKALRAGSEQRRQAILEAALAIIVRDGIRAVRHRAVAREAAVPLSATTYYFKDISDLIADTFTLFAERALEQVVRPFREQAFALLRAHRSSAANEPRRDELINGLASLTALFIYDEVTNQRDHLVAEQAFLQEAILDKRLRGLADLYIEELTSFLVQACEAFGSDNPALDGELIYSYMAAIERRLLTHPEWVRMEVIESRMRHLLGRLVPDD